MTTDDDGPKLVLLEDEWTNWRKARVDGKALIAMAKKSQAEIEVQLERYGIPGGPASTLAGAIIQHCGARQPLSPLANVVQNLQTQNDELRARVGYLEQVAKQIQSRKKFSYSS